jgi:hypothetical protein
MTESKIINDRVYTKYYGTQNKTEALQAKKCGKSKYRSSILIQDKTSSGAKHYTVWVRGKKE